MPESWVRGDIAARIFLREPILPQRIKKNPVKITVTAESGGRCTSKEKTTRRRSDNSHGLDPRHDLRDLTGPGPPSDDSLSKELMKIRLRDVSEPQPGEVLRVHGRGPLDHAQAHHGADVHRRPGDAALVPPPRAERCHERVGRGVVGLANVSGHDRERREGDEEVQRGGVEQLVEEEGALDFGPDAGLPVGQGHGLEGAVAEDHGAVGDACYRGHGALDGGEGGVDFFAVCDVAMSKGKFFKFPGQLVSSYGTFFPR